MNKQQIIEQLEELRSTVDGDDNTPDTIANEFAKAINQAISILEG